VQVKRNLFTVAAFHLCYKLRRQLFTVIGETVPSARNIARAPFSVQEEIWPYVIAGHVQRLHPGDHIEVAGGPLTAALLNLANLTVWGLLWGGVGGCDGRSRRPQL
jgi:hypothetical protein